MTRQHRPPQLPAFPRCRQRILQEAQPQTVRNLIRIQTWLIVLTLLQGMTLLALVRLGNVPMRWPAPSPRPETAFNSQARIPSMRSA